MKEKLILELKKEVKLLESWNKITKTGGWSTHLVEPMTKRINELKALLYDITNECYE
jgi:hypothetical protein